MFDLNYINNKRIYKKLQHQGNANRASEECPGRNIGNQRG